MLRHVFMSVWDLLVCVVIPTSSTQHGGHDDQHQEVSVLLALNSPGSCLLSCVPPKRPILSQEKLLDTLSSIFAKNYVAVPVTCGRCLAHCCC